MGEKTQEFRQAALNLFEKTLGCFREHDFEGAYEVAKAMEDLAVDAPGGVDRMEVHKTRSMGIAMSMAAGAIIQGEEREDED